MKKEKLIKFVLKIAIMFLVVLAPTTAIHAADGKNLTGLWGLTGTGVGYSGGEGDVFLLWLGPEGKAAVTSVQGCLIINWSAVWEAEGSTLRLTPEREDAYDAFWKGTYEYSTGTDILILRKENDEDSMVLTRREKSSLMTIPLTFHPTEDKKFVGTWNHVNARIIIVRAFWRSAYSPREWQHSEII